MRTVPVNQSVGPLTDGCDPTFLISMCFSLECCLLAERSTAASKSVSIATAPMAIAPLTKSLLRMFFFFMNEADAVCGSVLSDLRHLIRIHPAAVDFDPRKGSFKLG